MTTHEKKIYRGNNITNDILNFLYKHNKTNGFQSKIMLQTPTETTHDLPVNSFTPVQSLNLMRAQKQGMHVAYLIHFFI